MAEIGAQSRPEPITAEQVHHAARCARVRAALALAEADRRPVLAWLLRRYLDDLRRQS